MDKLKYILESLLFVSSSPLPMDRLRQAIPEADPKVIRQTLEDLEREYEFRGGGFSLHHVAGGYQLRTRPEYAQWIKRLHQTQPVRLSKAALETLAIIAYRQPVLRSDIEYIRGVDSGGVVKMLLEKQLIRVLGRDKEKAGRPMVYSTTKRFLEVFDLKDLSELPTLKELEELGLAEKLGDDEDSELQVEGAAGFAEFRKNVNAPDLTLDSPDNYDEDGGSEESEDAPDHPPEDGEDALNEPAKDEFSVNADRYPEEINDEDDGPERTGKETYTPEYEPDFAQSGTDREDKEPFLQDDFVDDEISGDAGEAQAVDIPDHEDAPLDDLEAEGDSGSDPDEEYEYESGADDGDDQ